MVVDPTEKQIGNIGLIVGLVLYILQISRYVIEHFNPQTFFEKVFMFLIHFIGWIITWFIVNVILLTIFYTFFWRKKC